jgi:predicted RND superfamily exporter protein
MPTTYSHSDTAGKLHPLAILTWHASRRPWALMIVLSIVLVASFLIASGVRIDTSSRVLSAGRIGQPHAANGTEKLVLLLNAKNGAEIKDEIVGRVVKLLERSVAIQPNAVVSILSMSGLAIHGDNIVAETPLTPDISNSGRRRGDIGSVLLNAARTETLIVARLDREPSSGLLTELRDALQKAVGIDHDILVGGDAAARAELSTAVITDLLVLGPLTALLLWLVLSRYYGSSLLGAAVLCESAVSGIITIGAMALLGEPITIMSVMMPVILLTSGIVDDVYFVDRALRCIDDATDLKSAIFHAAKCTERPIILGTATATAALLSLSWCGIPAFESLARVGTIAVLVSFVATFTLMPAMLVLLPPTLLGTAARQIRPSDAVNEPWIHWIEERAARGIVVLTIVVVFAGGWAAKVVPINDSWIQNLPAGETRDVSRIADQQLAGGSIAEVQIGFYGKSIWSAPAIVDLLRIADRVRAVPKVQAVWSPAEELINLRAMFAGRDATSERSALARGTERLTDAQADQFALLLSSTKLPFTSPSQVRKADVSPLIIAIKDADAIALRGIIDALGSRTEDSERITVALSDPIWRSLDSVDTLVSTSTRAVVDAILLIAAVVLVVMRSWRLAIVTGLTVAVAVAVIYICLWCAGASLGIATALFAPLAVGFGANSVTHLIAEFDACPAQFAERMAFSRTNAIPASMAGSLAAIIGFSVLLLSSIPANQAMAALIIGDLLASTAAAVFIAPALLHLLYGKLP